MASGCPSANYIHAHHGKAYMIIMCSANHIQAASMPEHYFECR